MLKRFGIHCVLFVLFTHTVLVFAQPKKPTLMILPSDNWCVQRYFITEYDNQGTKVKVPDYKTAFQEDTEIGQVISKIGSLMVERGFPLKDVEQELKNIESRNAEDAMTASTSSGSSITESPLDKLKNRAKADIIIQIWWKVNKGDAGNSVSFTLEAFDAYTSKRIAASSGNGKPSTEIIPIQLEKAVAANIELFSEQLQKHFDDLTKNGREILLTLKKWDSWTKNFESEFSGEELTDHINKWLQNNCVNGKYNISDATENIIRIEQVRIPIADPKGKALDARQFGRELQKWLKAEPFAIESKLLTRGLGEAILILGEK